MFNFFLSLRINVIICKEFKLILLMIFVLLDKVFDKVGFF